MDNKKYVLITPARDEEDFIETTIKSIILQKLLPQKWVIISDGSTDKTNQIIKKYSEKYEFIEGVYISDSLKRNFSSKVNAISVGLSKMIEVEYNFLGNLDADIALEESYYEKIIKKFIEHPELGLACGKIYDVIDGKIGQYFSYFSNVPGAAQVFRRKCFEDIGGYLPLEMGGEDTVAEVMARMHGWKVETFSDITVLHNRRTGTAQSGIYGARFRLGMQEYLYGSHPLFEIAKCVYRIKEKPYVIGSFLRACGYFLAFLYRERDHIPNEVLQYLRQEQMNKLRSVFQRKKRR
jgi:glycosyltransferase involved in cell wall biosynthesis